MQNAIPDDDVEDVAVRVARQTLARRNTDSYATEVRRLLDAALDVMRARGTSSRPRVADIVAAAGLNNDAFYRHFPSKDALVAALLEDGAQRLCSYVSHQMEKESAPEGKVRRWVEGVLAQADEESAATTLAVLWNGSNVGQRDGSGRHFADAPLAVLLHEPLSDLGSAHPELHATLVAHAVIGRLSDHLWTRTQPTRTEIDRILEFSVMAVAPRGERPSTRTKR